MSRTTGFYQTVYRQEALRGKERMRNPRILTKSKTLLISEDIKDLLVTSSKIL
jgi:hypothetical protein